MCHIIIPSPKAKFGGQCAAVQILLKVDCTAETELVRPAAQWHVVGNRGRVDWRKGWILINGQTKVSTADFRLVAGASVRAFTLIRGWAIDAVTAVALTIIPVQKS